MYYYLFEPQRGPKDFERFAQIKELLSSLGIAGEMASPAPGKSIEDLVNAAIAKRYSTVIAVGGIELANRTAHALEPHEAVFGIIPTVEHPDLTRLIGVSDWKSAAENLKRRRWQAVRMGSMNEQFYFLTPATVEVPADSGFRLAASHFSLDGLGGSIVVTPSAFEEESRLTVSISPGVPQKAGFLETLFGKREAALKGSQLSLSEFHLSTELQLAVSVAGAAITGTPVRFGVQPKELRLIVGKGNSQSSRPGIGLSAIVRSDFTEPNCPSIASPQLPINNRIRASRVFLIDEAGTPVGELDLQAAQQRAEEKELDLVLVGPQATPPVAKIMDYGKFRYEQDRKERKNKAKKTQEIKEIRLSYNTGENDLEVKLNQAKRFLTEGHKLKLALKLVGREMAFRDKAIEQLDRFRDMVGLEYEQPIQKQGKQMTVLLKDKK